MAQVTVTIDGKSFRMACDDGQEQHLMDLARMMDDNIAMLRESFGEIGDNRITMMAGIMVGDELAEVRRRVRGLEAEVASLREMRDSLIRNQEQMDEKLAQSLEKVAARIERVGSRLVANPPQS